MTFRPHATSVQICVKFLPTAVSTNLKRNKVFCSDLLPGRQGASMNLPPWVEDWKIRPERHKAGPRTAAPRSPVWSTGCGSPRPQDRSVATARVGFGANAWSSPRVWSRMRPLARVSECYLAVALPRLSWVPRQMCGRRDKKSRPVSQRNHVRRDKKSRPVSQRKAATPSAPASRAPQRSCQHPKQVRFWRILRSDRPI